MWNSDYHVHWLYPVEKKASVCPPPTLRPWPFTDWLEVHILTANMNIPTNLLALLDQEVITAHMCLLGQGEPECKWLPQKPDCYGVSTWFSHDMHFNYRLKYWAERITHILFKYTSHPPPKENLTDQDWKREFQNSVLVFFLFFCLFLFPPVSLLGECRSNTTEVGGCL